MLFLFLKKQKTWKFATNLSFSPRFISIADTWSGLDHFIFIKPTKVQRPTIISSIFFYNLSKIWHLKSEIRTLKHTHAQNYALYGNDLYIFGITRKFGVFEHFFHFFSTTRSRDKCDWSATYSNASSGKTAGTIKLKFIQNMPQLVIKHHKKIWSLWAFFFFFRP